MLSHHAEGAAGLVMVDEGVRPFVSATNTRHTCEGGDRHRSRLHVTRLVLRLLGDVPHSRSQASCGGRIHGSRIRELTEGSCSPLPPAAVSQAGVFNTGQASGTLTSLMMLRLSDG